MRQAILSSVILFFALSKINAQNFSWAVSMGGTQLDRMNHVNANSIGEIYSTGQFEGVVDFDPGPAVFNLTSAPGLNDCFIQKLDNAGNFLWAKKLDGDSLSGGLGTAIDGASNIYITGAFRGTKDFDPGTGTFNLTSTGLNDVFVLKLDANGNFIWAVKLGGISSDIGYHVTLDNAGNVLLAGLFRQTADFDPGPGVATLISGAGDNPNIFIVKLNTSGNFVWAKSLTSTIGQFIPGSISVDVSGNFYMSGSFVGTMDMDPGPSVFNLTTIGNNDLYVLKFDINGNFSWAKQVGVSNFGGAGGVVIVDGSNNLFISGSFGGGSAAGTADFDPGPGVFPLTAAFPGVDGFLLKLNSNGDFIWVKQMTAPGGWYTPLSTNLDQAGNVYATGYMQSTVDFDPGPSAYLLTSTGGRDVFVSKYDPAGNFGWALVFGGASDDMGKTLKVQNDNVITGGQFQETVDFNPGPGNYLLSSNGSEDMFISKFSQSTCFPPSQPGSINGNATVCAGTNQSYSISAVAGATSYEWTLPTGWTGTSTTTSITTTVGQNSGSISVKAANNCGYSLVRTFPVVVNTIPAQPSSISGSGNTIIGQTITYSISSIANATGYNWSISGGGIINSGQNTNTVSITWQIMGNYTLTVNASNSCGVGLSQQLNITVSTATGVSTINNPFEIKIGPNPTDGNCYLTAKAVQNKMIRIEIVNGVGVSIYSSEIRSFNNEYSQLLNLKNMAAGVYYVKIWIEGKLFLKKLVRS